MKIRPLILFSLFLGGLRVFGADLYFESNPLGQPLREIPYYRSEEFPYVLTVDNLEGASIHTLLHEGRPEKKWKRYYENGHIRTEEEYEADEIKERRSFNAQGEITEEISYSLGAVQEKRVYSYEGGFVAEVNIYDGQGNWFTSYSFIRGGDNRMRRVEKLDEQKKIYSYYGMNQGRVFQEWHGDSASGDFFRFDDKSRLSLMERWDEGTLSLKEDFIQTDSGRRSLLVNYKDGLKTEKLFDDKDNILQERTLKGSSLVKISSFAYDADGYLALKQVRSPGLKEEWRFVHDSGGGLAEETYLESGEIKKVTRYTGEKAYYEEIYRNGTPFIRVYFENDAKLREEFLSNPRTLKSGGGL